MSALRSSDVTAVLNQVKDWPPQDRRTLAESLLASLKDQPEHPANGRGLHNLVGLIAHDDPPLTDEDIERIREERYREKFGI